MTTGIYRGFSSYQYEKAKTFSINDVELVKLDLLNHIFTRKGERVMMPSFGTRIPDLAFEPMDQITLDVLEEDLRAVVDFDPRVQMLDLTITPLYDDNQVTATMSLLYIELDLTGNIDIHIVFEGTQ